MGGHHLIMGQLTDCVTGKTLADTHDERYRQRIANLLMEGRGYPPSAIHPRVPIDLHVDARSARIRLDFIIRHEGHVLLLVKYGPGSLVTRHQIAYAAARTLASSVVPFSIVTNGEDAHWLDNVQRKLLGQGLDAIWDFGTLIERARTRASVGVTSWQAEMAARILWAYEVDGRCPCDDTVCELES
ncbi:MAG: type I restriction enzyme HsdR N-terminal domain-containing protein [Desulfobacterales bacterium]|nr:type I restriction enzyme HsdR N-terminal domain-containing protein [Desulfobacterales bacterium]